MHLTKQKGWSLNSLSLDAMRPGMVLPRADGSHVDLSEKSARGVEGRGRAQRGTRCGIHRIGGLQAKAEGNRQVGSKDRHTARAWETGWTVSFGKQVAGDGEEGELGCEFVTLVGHPGGNPCHGHGAGKLQAEAVCEAQGAKYMYLGYGNVKVANIKLQGKGNTRAAT